MLLSFSFPGTPYPRVPTQKSPASNNCLIDCLPIQFIMEDGLERNTDWWIWLSVGSGSGPECSVYRGNGVQRWPGKCSSEEDQWAPGGRSDQPSWRWGCKAQQRRQPSWCQAPGGISSASTPASPQPWRSRKTRWGVAVTQAIYDIWAFSMRKR